MLNEHQGANDPNSLEAANYRYWQEHGGEWETIYQDRKKSKIYYHLQEWMLADYMHHLAPARVLEFGCGVGRHLRYLRRIPNIEVFGYDQSETMTASIRHWAGDAWFSSHVRVGKPLGPLPYPDQYFDLVYSAEVLIHIHPADLPSILREIMRVSRRQILHIEPSPWLEITETDHAGCWNHDLEAVYASLGASCKRLESAFVYHSPYRVLMSPDEHPYSWPSVDLELLRRLEQDIQPMVDRADALASAQQNTAKALDTMVADRDRLWEEVKLWHTEATNASANLAEATRQRDEFRAVINERTSRIHALEYDLETRDAADNQSRIRQINLERTNQNLQERLAQIEQSRSYRAIQRLRGNRALRSFYRGFIRLVRPRSAEYADTGAAIAGNLLIEATGERNPASQGAEVWLLRISSTRQSVVRSWSALTYAPPWQMLPNEIATDGAALVTSEAGTLTLDCQAEESLIFLTHAWSGRVTITFNGYKREVDLYSPFAGLRAVELSEMRSAAAVPAAPRKVAAGDVAWVEGFRSKNARTIAIVHPDWRGVRSSTESLFEHCLYVDDWLTEVRADGLAQAIAASGVDSVVYSGFAINHRHLIEALDRVSPSIAQLALWHGSLLQSDENYNWHAFKTLEKYARRGVIRRWGFVKKGMAEVIARTGLDTAFVMNFVDKIPSGPSPVPSDGRVRLGIWAVETNWRKSPFAMLAAAKLIDGARVICAGQSSRVAEYARQLDIPAEFVETVPQDEMPARLSQMHLNLYVTLSECAPMLPLESLSSGTPCLLGPNSHYFEDDDYLCSRLVVTYPDRSDVIADQIRVALKERSAIVEAYARYAAKYNQQAKASVAAFLNLQISKES